ncbi:GT2 family glycosyltransferase [Nitrobacteraceae bacterium AZCC 1564]
MFQFEPAQVKARSIPVQSGEGISLGAAPHGTAIIISTRGRPDIVHALVEELDEQSRVPEHIFVIGTSAHDIARLNPEQPNLTALVGREGSSSQRNDGLALAGSRFAYIAFFDDDFVPSRFWIERMEAVFEANPDVAGLTGIVLADGATTAGISLADARALVRARDVDPSGDNGIHGKLNYGGNMGCNMAFRASALNGIAFDERLPLYAWLEDADFRSQVERRGRVVRADGLWGVHLGHKQGRGRGVTIGYSQIANPIYLARKGTVPKSHLAKLAARNLIANLVRSIRPEPFVDRRGRLLGNVLALADLVRGRMKPERILEL